MSIKKLVILGFGQRGTNYAAFAKKNPDKFELVAIIENNQDRIEYAKKEHENVPVYVDYRDFLNDKVEADIVAVCTQDAQHKEHSIAVMNAGYDILLEKPIASTRADCLEIYKKSMELNRKVVVCHVLRYTPFYSTIKKLIDEGALGQVITINASENVGFYHQAHSFVRGPWGNSEKSCPMILAKCCHDMDIIRYLMGEKCVSVSSYGSLSYFDRSNAPKESAEFCSDCQVKDCIYRAQKIYTEDYAKWTASYFTTAELTKENIVKALSYTQYDRCVYKCDNDVVDHQVTIFNFENGKTACHTMTAFSKQCYRDIKIHGTKAELVGKVEDGIIELRTFDGDTKKIDINLDIESTSGHLGGHMGGDFFLMSNLHKVLNGQKAEGVSYLDVSIESHLMSFAAEKSRLNMGNSIKIWE